MLHVVGVTNTFEKSVRCLQLFVGHGTWLGKQTPCSAKKHKQLEKLLRNSISKYDFADTQQEIHTIDRLVRARTLVNIPKGTGLTE